MINLVKLNWNWIFTLGQWVTSLTLFWFSGGFVHASFRLCRSVFGPIITIKKHVLFKVTIKFTKSIRLSLSFLFRFEVNLVISWINRKTTAKSDTIWITFFYLWLILVISLFILFKFKKARLQLNIIFDFLIDYSLLMREYYWRLHQNVRCHYYNIFVINK